MIIIDEEYHIGKALQRYLRIVSDVEYNVFRYNEMFDNINKMIESNIFIGIAYNGNKTEIYQSLKKLYNRDGNNKILYFIVSGNDNERDSEGSFWIASGEVEKLLKKIDCFIMSTQKLTDEDFNNIETLYPELSKKVKTHLSGELFLRKDY